ncbi:carbohydrate-binding protein [Citrobacter freundii]|nr:carbohydrate-binding protein [Citrobacter freundii]MBA8034256.1 carbohydrate-binding protein [Citrobacter freundii]
MSKIARYQGNVRAFASDAQGLERTVFGGTNQADDLTSQITASFLRGWGIVGASEHPSLEDFNAAMYAMSQFIAYQHQIGVPEWHSEQEYHIGSICTHDGESYQSLQNANVGSQPPSAKWTPVLTSKNGLSNLGLGELALAGTMTGAFESAGYLKIPAIIGGAKRTLIVQWGLASGTTGKIATTYATAFPNAVLQVICSVADKSAGSGAVTLAVNQADITSLASRTTVTITPSNSDFQGTTTARFISIGY